MADRREQLESDHCAAPRPDLPVSIGWSELVSGRFRAPDGLSKPLRKGLTCGEGPAPGFACKCTPLAIGPGVLAFCLTTPPPRCWDVEWSSSSPVMAEHQQGEPGAGRSQGCCSRNMDGRTVGKRARREGEVAASDGKTTPGRTASSVTGDSRSAAGCDVNQDIRHAVASLVWRAMEGRAR